MAMSGARWSRVRKEVMGEPFSAAPPRHRAPALWQRPTRSIPRRCRCDPEHADTARQVFWLADDDHGRAYLRAGDFVTDEDAREVVSETFGIELVHQHARAHTKDMV